MLDAKILSNKLNNCLFENASYPGVLSLIGNTPIIELPLLKNKKLFAKLEYFNPTGSIKDRVALYIVEKAEREGKLKPGYTIIEASSGNQGIALAMIGAIKGYKVIITASEKISMEKKNGMLAYGAELHLCDGSAGFGSENHYYALAQKLHKQDMNSFFINQYLVW
jgi:cysteine synthase